MESGVSELTPREKAQRARWARMDANARRIATEAARKAALRRAALVRQLLAEHQGDGTAAA